MGTYYKFQGVENSFVVNLPMMMFTSYRYYAIDAYYPLNRFYYDILDDKDNEIRRYQWNFKKGNTTDVKRAVLEVSSCIQEVGLNLENAVLIIIPASNQVKTKSRFSQFCTWLSKRLGIINGFDAITTEPHEETKGTTGNKIKYFTFYPNYFKGKDVILFDDITTTQSSFKQVADRLMKDGAKSVTGFFLGKTTYEYDK